MSPLVRILLRYGSGALVLKGFIDSETGNMLATDPDVARFLELAIGTAMGAVSEVYYFAAKRYGWRT